MIKTILVIEDEILIQQSLKKLLERKGFLVDVSASGKQAITMILSQALVYKLNVKMVDIEDNIEQLQRENADLKLQMTQLADPQTIMKDAETAGMVKVDVKDVYKIGFATEETQAKSYAISQP